MVEYNNKETEVAHKISDLLIELGSGNSIVEALGTALYFVNSKIGDDYVLNEFVEALKERGHV